MFGLRLGEIIVIVSLLGSLIVPVLFFFTWANTLRLTRSYQPASPGLVWLMLIPVFNLVWQFYLLSMATKGIKGTLTAVGREPGDAAFGIGLAYQVLFCVAAVFPLVNRNHDLIELTHVFTVLSLLMLIVYWVRLARFNRAMITVLALPALAAPAS
jgi:hypothetical protein